MNYRLLGIDLDGTLLCPQGEISRDNLDAIGDAQDAGLTVVPCTGRSWRESRLVLDHVPGLGVGVYVTGSTIADTATGQTRHFTAFEPDTAAGLIDLLKDEPEAVLAFREHNRVGHEYLVTGNGELTDNSKWWFKYTGAIVKTQHDVTPGDLEHTLRISMVATGSRTPDLLQKVNERFPGQVEAHGFAAIQSPNPDKAVHILEVFPPGVDKWHGLTRVADDMGLSASQVAVIGDEINDIAMLQAAGCAIAMENGADAAKQHAAYVTKPNHDHGVAHAIRQILDGNW